MMRNVVTLGCLLSLLAITSVATVADEGTPKSAAKREVANDYGLRQVKVINEQISAQWKDNGLIPSPPASDAEWCRRVFLDVIGRVPTVDELHAFVNSKDAMKKAKLVDDLVSSDTYLDEYTRNWTTIWTNILVGRNGGTEDNTLISRPGMQKYLRDSFARNKPYNQMVKELVSATGGTAPGSPGFNGASNFLVGKLDENATQATAMTAKIFLGLQVQCTQCHNHPFNDWKQQKFWEMNAFFRQTRADRTMVAGTRNVASAQLVNRDFAGEDGNPEEATIFYELRNAEMKSALPVFLDGRAIDPNGRVSVTDRRKQLAELMMESNYLDITIANRMWQHFLGYGFTKPIDDLGPHNPPSHPELLEYLGKQVRENSYNMQELVKWITLSEAYSLSSRIAPGNKSDDPALGETPKFSHFYLRQMRAEELYESLVTATQAQRTKGNYEEQEKLKTEWLSQFVLAFGTDEGDETTTFNGTIPQVLMMFNGDLVKQATNVDQGSFLARIVADSSMRDSQKINYLFQSGLARNPTQKELAAANQLVGMNKGNVAAALQDIWWALLNSNEFIMNH